ncbi:hypothetical protein OCU04_008562 [Sclerotinia nivalis]|uniref:Uncharacterized protein n=1 Tax=Sclerotinia nivalis TaxID=352851 RepID=A0A9X0DJS7_9HELO|nr:hypothetical protein OCU04_008562 [Sclerotinia nivalis]
MDSYGRSKSDGPKVGSSSKSAIEEGRSASESKVTQMLDRVTIDRIEEDLKKENLSKRELRRRRRMGVRESMTSTRGAWDTERDKLETYADDRLYLESHRVRQQERKKEELKKEEEECRSLDNSTAESMKKKREDLKENESTLMKKITKIKRRKSIKKTLEEELKAYRIVKEESRRRVRDAQVEVDKTKLQEDEINHEMMRLWQNEADRWGEELEIQALQHKRTHSPFDFSADDMEYLRTSLENFRTHRDWCMNGPREGEPWFYTNCGRQLECDDCRDDIAHDASLKD